MPGAEGGGGAAKSDVPKDGSQAKAVDPPTDRRRRKIIDRLAQYVAQEGHPFEQLIMERETPDGPFGFLFQHDSPENVYYRWRTFAFAQGDNFKNWRTEVFQICDGGKYWKPPPCEAVLSAQKRNTNFSSAPPTGPPANKAVTAAAAAAAVAATTPSTGAGGGKS